MKSLLRLVARWWMPWWFLVSMTGLWIPTRKDSLTALQDEEQSPVIFITSYLPRWTWHGHNLQAYKPWAFPNWPDLWSQGPLFSPGFSVTRFNGMTETCLLKDRSFAYTCSYLEQGGNDLSLIWSNIVHGSPILAVSRAGTSTPWNILLHHPPCLCLHEIWIYYFIARPKSHWGSHANSHMEEFHGCCENLVDWWRCANDDGW